MEEWEYLEGHKDLYKDVLMEDQPPLTSPDGSRKRNPPDTCPRPLDSREPTQEDLTISHKGINPSDCDNAVKEEIKEEEFGEMEKFSEGYKGPFKDAVMEPLDDTNPAERCPRPLYSRDCAWKDQNIRRYAQDEDVKDIKVEVKEEEEETLVSGAQQSVLEGVGDSTQESHNIRHHDQNEVEVKVEEEEMLVSGARQSMEELGSLYFGDSTQERRNIPHHDQGKEQKDIKDEVKEEEEEMLVSGAQQSMAEGGPLYSQDSIQDSHNISHHNQREVLEDVKFEVKEEEEEMLVSGAQQSTEEGGLLYFQDSTQENRNIPHCQGEEQKDIKAEVKEEEEEMLVSEAHQCTEEGGPLYSLNSTQDIHNIPPHDQVEEQKDIKAEVKEEEEEMLVSGAHQSTEEGGPLYSQNSTQESHNIPHFYQDIKQKDIKDEVKEEEEEEQMLVSGAQPFMEDGGPLYSGDSTQPSHNIPPHDQGIEQKDIKDEVKEEEEMLVSGAHQSTEEGGPLYSQNSKQESHNIPHFDQGKAVKDMKVEVKNEEEMLVSGAQQSMEESGPLHSSDSTQESHNIPHHDQVKEDEETLVSGARQSLDEGKIKRKRERSSLQMDPKPPTPSRPTRKRTSTMKAILQQLNNSDSEEESLLEDSNSDSWANSSSDGETEQSDTSDSEAQSWCPIDCGTAHTAPPRFPFTGAPGLKVEVAQDNPLAYLKLFLTNDVINKIVTETNRYEQQQRSVSHRFSRSRRWEPVTETDIWRFLGLVLLQGVVGKPIQRWYWTTNKILATPFFGTVMSECRFSLIMKYLHFTNNEEYDKATHPAPKIKKIWDIYNMIMRNFQTTYVPERDVSVDKSLTAYKGRSWIQYMASKRVRFGLKSYMLCESSSGYIWNAIMYTGKGTEFSPQYKHYGTATASVLTLMEPLLNQGYCVTTDTFYSSPKLYKFLVRHKTDAYGTVRPVQHEMPPMFTKKKLKNGEVVAWQKGKIVALRWRSKKDIYFMSTIHNAATATVHEGNTDIQLPQVVIDYNNTMGGVDQAEQTDQGMTFYPAMRMQQKKYDKKIFRYLLEQCLWNAYVLFRKNNSDRPVTHSDFVCMVAECIFQEHDTPVTVMRSGRRAFGVVNPERLTGRHFVDFIPPIGKKAAPTRMCVICCSKLNHNGKKIRKETRYYCPDCDVGLCAVPCFRLYHTQDNY